MFPILNPYTFKAMDVQITFNLSLSKFISILGLQSVRSEIFF